MDTKQIESLVTDGKGYHQFHNGAHEFGAHPRWRPTDDNYNGLQQKLFYMDKSDGKIDAKLIEQQERKFEDLANPYANFYCRFKILL